ncbi:MAG: hypothetical protein HY908_00880 [Myxococcales bacterium]|nr:hypothetical protein [Myxococcales bacterium]
MHSLTLAVAAAGTLALSGCLIPAYASMAEQNKAMVAAAGKPPPVPANPAFEHSAAELDAFVEEHTKGYAPVGAPVEGRLGVWKPWDVSLERGRCYRMVIRLGATGRFSEHARRGLAFVYLAPGEPDVNGGPGVHGPGAVASAGCPARSHTATFDIQAIWGSAGDKSKIHELGEGPFTAQLYAKSITEKELAAQAADAERQRAESEAFARAEEQKKQDRRQQQLEGCAVCANERIQCQDRGTSPQSCKSSYDMCLFRYQADSFDSPCRR